MVAVLKCEVTKNHDSKCDSSSFLPLFLLISRAVIRDLWIRTNKKQLSFAWVELLLGQTLT